MEINKCLLLEKKIPNDLWVEVVNTSVYLLNRLPTNTLQDMTPFEAWCGNKPSIHHIKICGIICNYRVPKIKRNKLDNKAHKGTFVGYSSFKGYMIFRLKSEKLTLNQEVKFDEIAGWDWKNEKTSHSNLFSKEQSQLFDDELLDNVPVRGLEP
nr:uncharacterized protein LOC109121270 [Solanum lycopersicum]